MIVNDANLPVVGDEDGVITRFDLFQGREKLVSHDILPNMVVANPKGAHDITGLEGFVSIDRMLASYGNIDDWRAQLHLQAGIPDDTQALGRFTNMDVYEVPEIPIEDDSDKYRNTRAVILNRRGGLETGVIVLG